MIQSSNDAESVLDRFHPAVSSWFSRALWRADASAAAGLAGDRVGPELLDRRADGIGQDAGCVSGGA